MSCCARKNSYVYTARRDERHATPAQNSGAGDYELPEVSAVGRIPRKGSAGKTARVSRVDLLGTAGAGIWRSASGTFYFGTCAGCARIESNGAYVYGRSFGRVFVRGSAQGRIRKSGEFPRSERRPDSEERIYCGSSALR